MSAVRFQRVPTTWENRKGFWQDGIAEISARLVPSLDETLAFHDGDVVLVPRGYHVVSAPPGYELYYLNVMAGPVREGKIKNDPDHEWLLT